MRRRGAVLLALSILAPGLVGCDAAGPTPTPSPSATPLSGIRGRVLIGPTCPVEGPGGAAEPDAEPDPAEASGVPGNGSFDRNATPEPAVSPDPDATPDPESTPVASSCVQPYVAKLVITDPDGVATARLSSGPDGSFEVTLPAGDYTVIPESGDPFPAAQPIDVTVVLGQYAEVQLNFDTGIR